MSSENKCIAELRQRFGFEADDDSHDEYIDSLKPFDRFKMLVGWHIGDENFAYSIDYWLRSQGLCIAEKVNKKGVKDSIWEKVEIY